MRPPKYRAGQIVDVVGQQVGEMFDKEYFVKCSIIHPNEDGTYFVRVHHSDGYAVVDEDSISALAEYDIDKPYLRKRIRVVFFGNGHFALPTLRMLVDKGYDVAAVVTMEDKPGTHGRKPTPSPVKVYAESQGILVYQPHKLDSNRFIRRISNLRPTIGVVVEYSILPKSIFEIPDWGCINLHSSLLPMYRGASTITSAIKDGNSLTGVTTFCINDGVDTGRIINNLGIGIGDEETAEDIHIKLRCAGAEMVDDAIQRVAHSCHGIPQYELINDFIRPSHAPKLYRKDAFIRWCDSANKVYDFIRAHSSVIGGGLYPKNPAIAGSIPTAWTSLKIIGEFSYSDVKIHKASKTGISKGNHAPGEWFWQDGSLMVACSDELLAIEILQFSGKRRMAAGEYLNGLRNPCCGFCNLVPDSDD